MYSNKSSNFQLCKKKYHFKGFEDGSILLQSEENENNYLDLKNEMQEWFKNNEALPVKEKDIGNGLYGAYIKNSGIERIRVIKVEKNSHKVYLVDVGITTVLPNSDILQLPIQYKDKEPCIESFYPNKFKCLTGEWKRLRVWLKNRLSNSIVSIEKSSNKKKDCHYINMYEGRINIFEEMEANGLGQILSKAPMLSKPDITYPEYMDRKCDFSAYRANGSYPFSKTMDYGPYDQNSYNIRHDDPYHPLHNSSSSFNNPNNRPDHYIGPQSSYLRRNIYMMDAKPNVFDGGLSRPYHNGYGEDNHFSLSVIPPPPAHVMNKSYDDTNMEVSILKGQVKAYEHTLRSEQMHNFARQPLSSCTLLKDLLVKNQAVSRFVSDNSALVKAVAYIKEDTDFHNLFDNILQGKQDLDEDIKRQTRRNDKSQQGEVFHKLQKFLALVHHLNINEIVTSLELLQSLLTVSVDELKGGMQKLFEGDFRRVGNAEYSALANEFSKWRTRYLETHRKSEAAAKALGENLKRCGDFFSKVGESEPDLEVPTMEPDKDFQSCADAFEREAQILREISIIPKALHSVLEEVQRRLVKAKKAAASVVEVKELDPNSDMDGLRSSQSSPNPVPGTTYPTLLNFMRRSKGMHPKTKVLIIKDVFKALVKLHSQKVCYGFLTPENILLVFEKDEDAILAPLNAVSQYEPMPPFKFMAPDFVVSSANLLNVSPSLGDLYDVNELVDFTVDVYSLAQLIIWLAVVDFQGNFNERLMDIEKENPLLKEMISSKRPGLDTVKENLDIILANVFTDAATPEVNDRADESSVTRDKDVESDIALGKELQRANQTALKSTEPLLTKHDEQSTNSARTLHQQSYDEIEEEQRLQEQKDLEEQVLQEMVGSDDESTVSAPLEADTLVPTLNVSA